MPLNRDANTGDATSGAFRTKELCIHRAQLTTIADIIKQYPDAHVYEFTVQQALDAGATEVNDDRRADEPADHGMVLGTEKGSVAKKLKKVARRVYPP